MKIVMVCPDWFPYSAGLSQSCLEICKSLEAQGHEIRIIVAQDKKVDSKGMHIVQIPYLFRLLGRNPIPLGYWKRIKKHIDWADSVALFSYMYEMNSRIVLFKRLGLFNKPLIHFYRGSLEQNSEQYLSPLTRLAKRTWDKTLGKLIFTRTDKTLSNSKPTIKYIHQTYGLAKSKLAYIPTAIDISNYTASSHNNNRVSFIGRLVENKGVQHFESIVKVLPKDWTFTIVGRGPLEGYVRDLAKTYTNIEYLGKVKHSKAKEVLSQTDILVLPSYAEGSPRVVLEAGACKVPSVSFKVGDVPTVLPKELCISLGNDSGFTKQVQRLIENSTLRKKLGEEIYAHIKKEQDPQFVAKKIEAEFLSLS